MGNSMKMSTNVSFEKRPAQAIRAWGVFMVMALLINGTVPFFLGYDLHAWTSSMIKAVLFCLFIYGGMFLVLPLLLTKGWHMLRQPAFWAPVLLAILGIVLWRTANRFAAGIVVLVLAYLHWRFDLSELGFHSWGWKADLGAIFLMGLLTFIPTLIQGLPQNLTLVTAFQASLERAFGNPASTVENLFYFGFLTESLGRKYGRWLTPLLVGSMYTLHEMSNPEYWYSHMAFGWVFIGISVTAAVYLWRRNIVVIWLGDGLSRFVTRLG